jgi:hypothetical protein
MTRARDRGSVFVALDPLPVLASAGRPFGLVLVGTADLSWKRNADTRQRRLSPASSPHRGHLIPGSGLWALGFGACIGYGPGQSRDKSRSLESKAQSQHQITYIAMISKNVGIRMQME